MLNAQWIQQTANVNTCQAFALPVKQIFFIANIFQKSKLEQEENKQNNIHIYFEIFTIKMLFQGLCDCS